MSYITLIVKIEEDDIKEYLSNYLTEEEIENTDIKSEAREAVSGILSDHLCDYAVIDDNTLVIGEWD